MQKKLNRTRDIWNFPTQGWADTAFCMRKRNKTCIRKKISFIHRYVIKQTQMYICTLEEFILVDVEAFVWIPMSFPCQITSYLHSNASTSTRINYSSVYMYITLLCKYDKYEVIWHGNYMGVYTNVWIYLRDMRRALGCHWINCSWIGCELLLAGMFIAERSVTWDYHSWVANSVFHIRTEIPILAFSHENKKI